MQAKPLLAISTFPFLALLIAFLMPLLFIFETERDRAWAGEGQRERETQNRKQVPGSELSAQSPTRGSNPRTMRSWPGPKLDTQPTEPPRRPSCPIFDPNHMNYCSSQSSTLFQASTSFHTLSFLPRTLLCSLSVFQPIGIAQSSHPPGSSPKWVGVNLSFVPQVFLVDSWSTTPTGWYLNHLLLCLPPYRILTYSSLCYQRPAQYLTFDIWEWMIGIITWLCTHMPRRVILPLAWWTSWWQPPLLTFLASLHVREGPPTLHIAGHEHLPSVGDWELERSPGVVSSSEARMFHVPEELLIINKLLK